MVQDATPRVDLFERGLALFNAGEYYECHEVWEELWTATKGGERLFLQALIHFAVSLYHFQQANPVGAERQLSKALKKLAGYLPVFRGIDTQRLYHDGQRLFSNPLADAPQIVRCPDK